MEDGVLPCLGCVDDGNAVWDTDNRNNGVKIIALNNNTIKQRCLRRRLLGYLLHEFRMVRWIDGKNTSIFSKE